MTGTGIPTTYPAGANFPGHVLCSGSFRPNGATGIVSGSVKGNGFTVARTSAGLYTVTFDSGHSFPSKVSVLTGVRVADATPTIAQGGDYSEANRTIQIRVLQAATAEISESTGSVPIDIMAARELGGTATFPDLSDTEATDTFAAGGYLALDSTPTLTRKNGTTDRMPVVTWAAGDVQEIALPAIPIPRDIAADSAISVNAIIEAGGTTDAGKTVDILAYYHKAGSGAYSADTEMGGNLTIPENTNVNKLKRDLAEADLGGAGVTAYPGMLSLSLLPAAHANDPIILHGIWLEYGRADEATTGQVFAVADMAADVDAEVSFAVVVDNDLVAG